MELSLSESMRTTSIWIRVRLARQVTKLSQSHDLNFFQISKKVKVMSLTLTWLSDFFHYFFDFFFRFFDSKKGPNCPKVCQKCKLLTKWPFGTKRKRQNVFSISPSKKFKVIFLTFLQISYFQTLLDFSLKKWLSAQVWLGLNTLCDHSDFSYN
jgi:hypothetical protein